MSGGAADSVTPIINTCASSVIGDGRGRCNSQVEKGTRKNHGL